MRIAAVSYFNARPLIEGLDRDPSISLSLEVPSRLLDLMREAQADVALLPVIDLQRLPGLCIVPSGGIGCDGPTLTVRIFASIPIPEIRSLACDHESHTSVALARIILAERFGLHPELVPDDRTADARLLIGDKVVCNEPPHMPHQLDLGQEWKALTALPFVFAVWTARAGVDLGDLPQQLERAKRDGLSNARELVERHAIPRGWPADLALKYITQNLKYDIGPRELKTIAEFHRLAHRHGIIHSAPSPAQIYASDSPITDSRR
jgi:chorismate dehydratase